MLNGIRVS